MTVTKFYISLNVSLTDICCNLWDFANKLIIIQVQYGKKGRIQKEAQICCIIILLTLCISLFFIVWNSDTRRRLSLDRTFFLWMFEKVAIQMINSLSFERQFFYSRGKSMLSAMTLKWSEDENIENLWRTYWPTTFFLVIISSFILRIFLKNELYCEMLCTVVLQSIFS